MTDVLLTEKELLSILVLKPEIGFDLLQINPKHLSNGTHRVIFEALLKCYKKHGTTDIPQLITESKIDIDVLVEIINDEYVPITDIRKQFMACQITILDNYKKNAINLLSQKLNTGNITCDEYLEKIEQVGELSIKVSQNYVTEEEIINNFSLEKKGIELKKFPLLNKILEMAQGEFVIVGATTGMGKSGLLLNFMNDLMDRYQCIYFNMEMSKTTIYKRMVSINSGIPLSYVDKPVTDYQAEKIKESIARIVANKVIVEHKATYMNEIRNILKVAKNDSKHTIIFLDHVGLIQTNGVKSIYEHVTKVAKDLRQLCLDYDCTIISACQLNRTAYKTDNKSLDLSMLKDSGELENSGSRILFLMKENEDSFNQKEERMILKVMKNRDGKQGEVTCDYDKSKQIFKEVEEWKQKSI